MVQETPKSLLKKTKEIILEKGWTQGQYQNHLGQVCLSQALWLAAKNNLEVERLVTDAIYQKTHHHYRIIGYNDGITRTKEDILNVLDRAIALATP